MVLIRGCSTCRRVTTMLSLGLDGRVPTNSICNDYAKKYIQGVALTSTPYYCLSCSTMEPFQYFKY